MVLLASIISISLVQSVAANDIEMWVRFDKAAYEPGEQGTIFITIRNTGTGPIEINNVTLTFPQWMIFTEDGWDPLGNKTIPYEPAIIVTSKTVESLEAITFTVPTDGRAGRNFPTVEIRMHTSEGYLSYNGQIEVLAPYTSRSLRALDNIVMLLTVVAILAIVSAIIIAAAVFLSGRRPGVTWQKEE